MVNLRSSRSKSVADKIKVITMSLKTRMLRAEFKKT